MSSKPKSFEEFYYTKQNAVLDIEKVSAYAKQHDGDYAPYKWYMFCPECKKAGLTFIHRTTLKREHLKRIPSTSHLESCSYNYGYASRMVIKKFVDNLTHAQIQDRLNAIMNMFFDIEKPKDISTDKETKEKKG